MSRTDIADETTASPAAAAGRRPAALLALALGLLLVAFTTLASVPARAAAGDVNQCNGVGPSAAGATTGMVCTVEVWNTIDRGRRSSVLTLTRLCALGPCPSGNGTFTTRSTSLVTDVVQCNGSDNDAAHVIRCDVRIHNSITSDTPGAGPLAAATVNQCVGSAQGGGGSTLCGPYPASTTGATVTQCNGSANGGGATIACTVATASRISGAIPVRVNQCNGTGNPGGSTVICSVSITTALRTVAPTATPTLGTRGTGGTTGTTGATTSGSTGGTTGATTTTGGTTGSTGGTSGTTGTTSGGTTGTTSGGTTGTTTGSVIPPTTSQVTRVPRGGVPAGSGAADPTTGTRDLAYGLLLVAAAAAADRARRSHRTS